MGWGNSDTFAGKAKVSATVAPRTMPEAMRFVLRFGKWDGCTLSHIINVDPGYIPYLLKSSKPQDPVHAAAQLVQAAATRSYERLDSIGKLPPPESMDELWPELAEQALQEMLENDAGFQQECCASRYR